MGRKWGGKGEERNEREREGRAEEWDAMRKGNEKKGRQKGKGRPHPL